MNFYKIYDRNSKLCYNVVKRVFIGVFFISLVVNCLGIVR